MGLADRDYARAESRTAMARRPGAVRLISVNTWLIIVNIAVYIIANDLLSKQFLDVDVGIEWFDGVTPQEQEQGRVDMREMSKHPQRSQEYFYRTVYVPALDAAGRVVNGPDGQPRLRPGGRQVIAKMPVVHALGHFSTARLIAHWE